jgi:hypothetical protein
MIARFAAMTLVCANLLASAAHTDGLEAILSKAAGGQKAPGAGLLTIRDFGVSDGPSTACAALAIRNP